MLASNYVLQRTGGDVTRFNQSLRPARPLNTALDLNPDVHARRFDFCSQRPVDTAPGCQVTLGDILKDQHAHPDLSDHWRVVLATRSLPGAEIAEAQVHILDIGGFEIDEEAREIDILPTSFMPPGTPAITMADCLALLARSPELADFSLCGVTRVKTLADGGRALSSDGIIGSYVLAEDEEYWLLLAPQSQWPARWFGV